VFAQSCAGDCNGDVRVTIDELVTGVSIALAVAPLTACEAVDENGNGSASVDELITAVDHALTGCPRQMLAFVVATDFETGSFATISLDEPRTIDPAGPQRRINADAVPRVFQDLVFIVNRFFGDNLQVLDPARSFSTTVQCSTGGGSNPQDIAFVDESKAYMTALDDSELLIVDPTPSPDCTDFIRGTIDLSAFADADGLPEMSQMAIVGGQLFVTLQKLDRNNFFSPSGPGSVVVIDTVTDEIVRELTLAGMNPFASTKGLVVRNGSLFIGEVGAFGVNDGGIEQLDPVSGESAGFVVTEEALGGDITDFVFVSEELAYAIISNPDFTNSVIRFDPSNGSLIDSPLAGVQFISDIELNDRGELFVSDRTAARPGIRILRAADGTEITVEPLDVGLPPFEIVFLE
jgi:hypothetical protein